MLRSSDEEKKFREDSETNRETLPEYKKFRERNGEALGYLARHLTTRVMMRVDKSVSAAQMYDTILKLYKTSSDVGRDSARQDFFALKFNEGGDMRKYIEVFEMKAEKFRAAGGRLDDQEELEQFRTSLPSSYNDVRKWFSSLSDDKKTFENLKRQVIEDHEYRVREKRNDEKFALTHQRQRNYQPNTYHEQRPGYNFQGNHRTNDRRADGRNSTGRSESLNNCYECGGTGHFGRECPTRNRRNDFQHRGGNPRRRGESNRRYSEPARNNNQSDDCRNSGDRRDGRNDDWRNRNGNSNTNGNNNFWENFHGNRQERGDQNKNENTYQRNSDRGHSNSATNQRAQNTNNNSSRNKIPFLFVSVSSTVKTSETESVIPIGPRRKSVKLERIPFDFDTKQPEKPVVTEYRESIEEIVGTSYMIRFTNEEDDETPMALRNVYPGSTQPRNDCRNHDVR